MKKVIFLSQLIPLIFGISLQAQDLESMTLNFKNVTATNLNSTVAEQNNNEKEVDFADYDLDGDIDVVIATALSDFGQRRNKLYRNDNGVLNEVSGSPVIPGFSNTDTSRSAFFRDFNNDGYADIIVINDSNSGIGTINSPGRTKLYINNGDGTFTNQAQQLDNQTGAACNGAVGDFDGNGFLDLFMANYPNTTQDSLGLNNINSAGPGEFTESTAGRILLEIENNFTLNLYAVHAEAEDMNGDGKIDLLVANGGGGNETSYIAYNDNDSDPAGSDPSDGEGDFLYSDIGNFSNFGSGDPFGEYALVPADFNNDGMMDFYYANSGDFGGRSDSIHINEGNDASNRATFSVHQINSDFNNITLKVTCNDLDGDNLPEIIVMSEQRRPYIMRNVSNGSDIRFVEWTPTEFTSVHEGWQANSANLTGDERADILVGATNDDFLFENEAIAAVDFDTLGGGFVPAFFNADPIAVSGTIDVDETVTMFVPANINAEVSVLMRSTADLGLSVSTASSDRTGAGVAEAVQYVQTNNSFDILTIVNNGGGGTLLGDLNGDGDFNLLDVAPFVDLLSDGGFDAAADFDGNGIVNLLDVNPFVDALSNGGSGSTGPAPFVVEFMSRSN